MKKTKICFLKQENPKNFEIIEIQRFQKRSEAKIPKNFCTQISRTLFEIVDDDGNTSICYRQQEKVNSKINEAGIEAEEYDLSNPVIFGWAEKKLPQPGKRIIIYGFTADEIDIEIYKNKKPEEKRLELQINRIVKNYNNNLYLCDVETKRLAVICM